jgi:hypothetical protein
MANIGEEPGDPEIKLSNYIVPNTVVISIKLPRQVLQQLYNQLHDVMPHLTLNSILDRTVKILMIAIEQYMKH